MKHWVPMLAAALLAMSARTARASDGESALSLSLGYGTYNLSEERIPHGAVVAVEYERGLTDAWAWRVAVGGGGYYDGTTSGSGHVLAGVTYVIDVLKYVPYLQVGAGGLVISSVSDPESEGKGMRQLTMHPLLEVGAGLDILHSRSLSYGVKLGFESLISQTAFFTAGVRLTWRWGFF